MSLPEAFMPSIKQKLDASMYTVNPIVLTANNTQTAQSLITGGTSAYYEFYLPVAKHTLINPSSIYLEGVFTAPSAEVVTPEYIDSSAYSFISRVQVSYGNVPIFDCNNYDVLMSLLRDLTTSEGYANSVSSAMDLGGLNQLNGASEYNYPIRIGQKITTASQVMAFSIPLMCNLFNSDHYLLLNPENDRFKITIYLQNIAQALYRTTSTSLSGSSNGTLSNVNLLVDLIKIDAEEFNREYAPLFGMNYGFSTYSWINYQITKADAATSVTYTFNAQYESIKSIIVCQRLSSNLNSINAFSVSDRQNFGLQTFDFRIGGDTIPSQKLLVNQSFSFAAADSIGLGAYIRYLYHTLGAMHQKGSNYPNKLNPNYHRYSINGAAFPIAPPGSTTYSTAATLSELNSSVNCFCIAYDFEIVQNDQSIFNGINTKGMDVVLEATYASASPAITIDLFVCYDQIVSFQQGVLTDVR